jgi:hypothetical protein
MAKLSFASWLYLTVVVAVAGYILWFAPIGIASPQWWSTYAVLALLFLICDSTPTPLAARQSAWSPSSAATLAAVVLLNGGIGAAMVGAVAVLTLRRQVPLAERLFNGAMYAVAGFLAGRVYLFVRGSMHDFWPHIADPRQVSVVHIPSAAMFGDVLGPFAAAAVVHVLVNHGLLYGMLMLDRHARGTVRRCSLPISGSPASDW